MKMKIRKTLYNNHGAALPTVLMLLVVIMILTASVMMIFGNNLHQSKHQEERIQAYYLALSGIDLGVSALLTKMPHPDPLVGGDITLLDDFKWDPSINPDIDNDLSSKPEHIRTGLRDRIEMDNGAVDITIRAINTNGQREVEVHALGSMNDSSVTNSITLVFLADNPLVKRWH